MGKKHDKPLHLDIPFEEALGRFARTDPGEVKAEKNKKAKKLINRAVGIRDAVAKTLPKLE